MACWWWKSCQLIPSSTSNGWRHIGIIRTLTCRCPIALHHPTTLILPSFLLLHITRLFNIRLCSFMILLPSYFEPSHWLLLRREYIALWCCHLLYSGCTSDQNKLLSIMLRASIIPIVVGDAITSLYLLGLRSCLIS